MAFFATKTRIGTVMYGAADLVARQNENAPAPVASISPPPSSGPPRGFVEEDGHYVWFWYSRTGIIIKWSLFLGFVVLIGGYLVIGHIHAKRRIRKGLRPLAYHRFLVGRQQLASVDPAYAYPHTDYSHPPGQGYYGMHPVPAPVYDPNRPPVYTASANDAKINPNQDYAPPPGPPPPAAQQPDRTGGSTNPFDDPVRR